MTDLPTWADAELSAALPALVLSGETQTAEFKREFPRQVSDFAKEIAGFATSNAGAIYIGVDDDCSIVGLEAGDYAGRAAIVQRIEGICANAVKPSITPRIRFADIEGKCVLAINVPKGKQPIYWVGNIPYMRQVTAARPMTPDEVIEAIVAWSRAQDDDPTPGAHFLGALANLLVDAHIAVEEIRIRDLDPWLSDLKYQLDAIADDARELAASAPHEMEPTIDPLEHLAEACETIAADDGLLRGPGVEYVTALDEVEQLIKLLRARWLGPGRFNKRHAEDQTESVRVTARRLAGFASRIDPDEDEEDELKENARDRGLEILRAASLGIGVGNEKQRQDLWDIGMAARELETRDVFFDGGDSLRKLIDGLGDVNKRLQTWLANLSPA